MRIGVSINGQVREALVSLAMGFGAGMLYDAIRVLRRKIKSVFFVALFDAVFWFICAISLFVLGLDAGNGKQRLFMLIISISGAILYFAALSPVVRMILDFLADGVEYLGSLLLFPVRKLKIVVKKCVSKLKNSFLIYKNGIK